MTTNPLRLFGRHLATLRKQRGWSQETLALESGLARSYLSGIERGVRNVALANICALADTLSLPPQEMLAFSGEAAANGVAQARHGVAPRYSPAVEATLRHMAELPEAEQDVVAAVARALARKPGR